MKIGVVGGGSWGTALAYHAASLHDDVTLWALEAEIVEEINVQHTNQTFLPDIVLPENLVASNNIDEVVSGADIIISVVPSQFLRSVVRKMPAMKSGVIIVSASKGIENSSLMTPTQIYEQEFGKDFDGYFAALGGPSFAKEVVRKHPTAVVVACEDHGKAIEVQKAFSSEVFRIYTSTDEIGVEICGSVKNVIALASGACSGLGFGDNTRAALITRGISEISRLVKALNGTGKTVAGMAGLGDLVSTCTSSTSRNYQVGFRLGEGESLEEITSSMKMIAEGVKTTKSVHSLSEKLNIEMPISQVMNSILYQGMSPLDAVKHLMTRELKQEWETEDL